MATTGKKTDKGSRTRVISTWAIMLAGFRTGAIVMSLVWNIGQVRELVLEQAQIELRANFLKDLAFRNWATRHGGVYVAVTPQTQPDPYVANLPERDVRTPSGRVLTLINPALMVRQFNEMATESYGALALRIGLPQAARAVGLANGRNPISIVVPCHG